MTAGGRVPPHDLEAEKACIGSALLDRECVEEMIGLLHRDDFYKDANGTIWEAIEHLHRNGGAIDTLGLRAQLEDMQMLRNCGGDEYLMTLTEVIPTVTNAAKYAKRVTQLAHVRTVINRCYEVIASGYAAKEDLDEWADAAESLLHAMPEQRGNTRSVPFADVVDHAYKAINAQKERGTHMVGPGIGLERVDDHLRGLAPSWLVVLAARPGMGKTALAENALRNAGGGLVFSLEMDRRQWGTRTLSSLSGVDGHEIRGAVDLTRDEWAKLTHAAGVASTLPIRFWDKPGTTLQEILREARRCKREMGDDLKLIVVDYLQLVRVANSKARTREEEVGEISRSFKSLAKELQVCVMALAQLNRGVESRPNKRPLPSDLRESGAIEQDADVIMFVYRDEVYNPFNPDPAVAMKDNRGIAEIIISKNREGSTGTAFVQWRKQTTTFRNLHRRDDPDNVAHWDSDDRD